MVCASRLGPTLDNPPSHSAYQLPGSERRKTLQAEASLAPSGVASLQHQGRIGAAEAEAVQHYTVKVGVVLSFPHDGHVGELGVELVDIGALANETVTHHEQREDRLLHADRAQRMAGERLGRGDRGDILAEHLADCVDLLLIADRRAGTMRVDVVDPPDAPAVEAVHGRAHAPHRTLTGGCHHVEAIGGGTVARHLPVNPSPAAFGPLQLLQYHHAGSTGDHEAVAALVIGATGFGRSAVEPG